jgi:hypothetical protein
MRFFLQNTGNGLSTHSTLHDHFLPSTPPPTDQPVHGSFDAPPPPPRVVSFSSALSTIRFSPSMAATVARIEGGNEADGGESSKEMCI